jgi:hypothetical protein
MRLWTEGLYPLAQGVMTSYDALNVWAEDSFEVRSLCGWSLNTMYMERWDKRWIYGVSLFIYTPVQQVLGTVGQVRERLVRAPTVQKPHGKNERAVQTPSLLTHDARWNSALEAQTRFIGFRGAICSIFTACGAAGMNQVT